MTDKTLAKEQFKEFLKVERDMLIYGTGFGMMTSEGYKHIPFKEVRTDGEET